MRTTLFVFFLIFSLLSVANAASNEKGVGADSPAPQKSTPADKKLKSPQVGLKTGKSEAQIHDDLEETARKLTAQAARTLRPSKNAKEVKKVANEHVATYLEVDTSNLATEMRPADKPGTYVGIIRYSEQIFECRGNDPKAAMDAPCEKTVKNHRTEMILYDGKKWQY